MIRTQVDICTVWPLCPDPATPGKGGFATLGDLVTAFLPLALLLGGIIFFGLVVYAGFSMITGAGSGDAQAQEKWKQILTKGIIGLIIIFGAFWVLQIINFITGGALKDLIGP